MKRGPPRSKRTDKPFPYSTLFRSARDMGKQYWLMKSEPDVYGWDNLVQDGSGIWDGVRNHSAKLNMQAMKVGDEAFFYHSNNGKECVGIMLVTQAAFPDTSDDGGDRKKGGGGRVGEGVGDDGGG